MRARAAAAAPAAGAPRAARARRGLYEERLAGLVETPSAAPGDTHGWQAYVVALDRRDEALAALRAEGIEAQIGTYALHRLAAYAGQGEFWCGRPLPPRARPAVLHGMGVPEVDRVVEALRPFADQA